MDKSVNILQTLTCDCNDYFFVESAFMFISANSIFFHVMNTRTTLMVVTISAILVGITIIWIMFGSNTPIQPSDITQKKTR